MIPWPFNISNLTLLLVAEHEYRYLIRAILFIWSICLFIKHVIGLFGLLGSMCCYWYFICVCQAGYDMYHSKCIGQQSISKYNRLCRLMGTLNFLIAFPCTGVKLFSGVVMTIPHRYRNFSVMACICFFMNYVKYLMLSVFKDRCCSILFQIIAWCLLAPKL